MVVSNNKFAADARDRVIDGTRAPLGTAGMCGLPRQAALACTDKEGEKLRMHADMRACAATDSAAMRREAHAAAARMAVEGSARTGTQGAQKERTALIEA